MSRIATLAAESLEPRTVMAAFTYVDDSWSLTYDVDQSGGLSNGDIVSSGSIAATYGSTAFGTVIGQTGVAGSQTIANAVTNTDAGGTLRILEGSYTEDLAVAKSLNIVGDGANLVTLNGSATAIAISGASNVSVDGISVTGAATGIRVDGPLATVAVTDSRIAGNGVGISALSGGSITSLSGNDFEAGSGTANDVDLSIAATAGPVTVGGNNKFGAAQFYVDNQSAQDLDLTAAGNTFEGLSNFDIEDKIHHAVDTDLALTNGLVTWVAGNIYVTNSAEAGTTDSSIQRGIDVADAGTTVNLEAGTYAEAVTLNKSLTLLGAGSGDAVTDTIITSSGVIANITASDVTVKNLRVSGGTRGIQVGAVSNTLLDTIAAVGVAGVGTGVEVGGPATNLQIVNSLLSGNSVGLRMGTAASLDGLTVTDSTISNNNQGIFVAVNNPSTSYLKNVDFTNTVISNNLIKGAYIEKLQDATFTNITVTNNGTDTAYNFNAGFDINLKHGNYSNISFVDSTFTDNGIGATTPAFPGYGLAIKARNDGAYTANPASLSGVTLTNVTINATAATPAAIAGLALGNNIDLDTVTLTNVDFGGAGSLGLSVFGASSGDTLNLGDTDFAADLVGYVINQSAGVIVDGTAATYGGVAGGASLATLDALAIADKVVDNVDVATFGKVVLRSGHVYVTPNSFFAPLTVTPSIQRGVNAANATDTVHVGAGEYVDQVVNINKALTLSGANAGLSAKGQANRDARGPETLLSASATGVAMGITVTAADVTIDGIEFFGAGLNGGSYAHIAALAENLTVRNVISNSNLVDPFQPGGNAMGIVTGYGLDFDGLVVENSFFARQRTAVYVNLGSGTNTLTFDGNEFATRTAVNHDLGFTSLNSTFTNNLFAKVDVDGYEYGPATGVNVAVVPNGGSVVFTGNQIAANFVGVDLKDVQAGGTVSFNNNTFTDHTAAATGVRVNAQNGANITFTGNTFANATFINNVGPAGLDLSTGGNQVDLGSGPVDLATADLATAFQVADKVIDGIDTGNTGMVRLQAGNVFVTPNSFFAPTTTAASIQRGVDYAAVNDAIHVAAGTYTISGPVIVNKTVSLLGAQAGVDARTRTAVDETIVDGAGGSFSLGADNIVLDGFTIQGQTGSPLGTAIHAVASVSGHQILNNIVQDNQIGLYFGSNGIAQSVVEQNLFRDNNNPGAAGGTALYSDQGLSNALIQKNTFTGDNPTAAVNLVGTSVVISTVDIWLNAFETGNQLVLFNVDSSTVFLNTFTGSLPSGSTGSGVFVGGGNDGLTITSNTFTDRGSGAISVSDQFGAGPNTNLFISNNSISQNVNLLPAGRSMISLTDVQGALVDGNLITLSGTIDATVPFVHGINVAGATTGNVQLSGNDVLGISGGGSAGVRLRSTLSGSATIDVANNKINGFDHGVLADALATGIDVDINRNDLSGNALFAVTNGAGELLDASGNWLGSNTPAGAAAAVSGAVDYSPWLNVATDTDGGVRGFQGDLSVLHVDDNSPQAPGFAGRIDEALNLLANDGTLFLHGGVYAENVNTSGKAVTLELGSGVAGVTINGSLTLDADDTLRMDLGTLSSDQLEVTGNVLFGGATLEVTALQPLTANSLLLLSRRGGGNDTFGNLAQGQQIVVGGQTVTARYDLGDGNDFGFLTASNPVISDVTGPLNYVENASPILLSQNANLSDLDNTNMNGGSLQVVITSGGDGADRIGIRNEGIGAGQIGVSGNEITYGGVLIGTFTGGVGTTPLEITFTSDGAATLQAVQALLRNLTYSSVSESPSGPKDLAYVLQDGNGGVGAAVQNVTITPVADNPFVSPNGQANYTENSAPVVLAPLSYVTDADNASFAGGALTVAITNNAQAADQLVIQNAGTGPGQIGVSGNDITFEGVLIGTFSGGTGTTPLVISLNGSATIAATTALLRAISFVTPGDNPAATYRTVTFQLTDGAGGVSNVATKLVRVIAVNDAPTIGMQLSKNYQAGTTPIVLSPSSAVTDPDSWSFSGGVLTVSVENADAGDRVGIQSVGTGAGQISVSGSQVLYGGVVIATFTGGSGSTPLVVSFNGSATRVGVQAVVRSITFSTVSAAAPRGLRNVNFVLTDGDGGTSPIATKPVYIVAPAPSSTLAASSIGLSGGQTVSYSRSGASVAVLPQGVVNGNPAKGKLTVANASGQAADRLTVGGRFSVNQGILLLNGIAVGTVNNGGGIGKTSLVISLNDKATQSLVQELVRSIKFHTASHAAQTARVVSFTLAAANGTRANTSATVSVR